MIFRDCHDTVLVECTMYYSVWELSQDYPSFKIPHGRFRPEIALHTRVFVSSIVYACVPLVVGIEVASGVVSKSLYPYDHIPSTYLLVMTNIISSGHEYILRSSHMHVRLTRRLVSPS